MLGKPSACRRPAIRVLRDGICTSVLGIDQFWQWLAWVCGACSRVVVRLGVAGGVRLNDASRICRGNSGISAPRGSRCGGRLDHRARTHGGTCGKGAPVAGRSHHRSVRFLSWSLTWHRGDRGQPRRLRSRICPRDGCSSRRRHRPCTRHGRFYRQTCSASYGRTYRSWWICANRGLT